MDIDHSGQHTGTTTFSWLHGSADTSFFLQQDTEMDYAGTPIKSREIIGYDPKTKAFSSYVYSNMAPDPWPYTWDVHGDNLTISIKSGPMNATFHGTFRLTATAFQAAGGQTRVPTRPSTRPTTSPSAH